MAESFKVLLKTENNFIDQFSGEEYRHFRRRMIECILATDMVNHAKHLTFLKNKFEGLGIKNGNCVFKLVSNDPSKSFENQQLVMNMCVHSADVSNPAKPYEVYKTWVNLVFEEFFNQGDLEKSQALPVSMMCDRNNTSISKSQIGFINFVVLPTFDCLMQAIPELEPYKTSITHNLGEYEKKLQEEEKLKENK